MNKKIDILVLAILFVIGIFYANFTKDMLIGRGVVVAAVYIIPSIIYLNLRSKLNWPKIIIATIVFRLNYCFLPAFY